MREQKEIIKREIIYTARKKFDRYVQSVAELIVQTIRGGRPSQNKQLSTYSGGLESKRQYENAAPQNVRCCYISALVLTCYRLKKGRATFYRPETIVASLLLLMVLSLKVIFNHILKRQFMVLHFRLSW